MSTDATGGLRARLQLLTKDQGGRHTPIFDEYRPRFLTETADVGVAVVRLVGQPMMMPGQEIDVVLEPVDATAWAGLAAGQSLQVFEDTRQVGVATLLAP